MTTAGLAVIEWLMLATSCFAKAFQREQTPQNLTLWCNAQEVLTDRENTPQRTSFIGRKLAA